MKIKTLIKEKPEEIDLAYNEFANKNSVKFSQSDSVVLEGKIYHKMVIFYEE